MSQLQEEVERISRAEKHHLNQERKRANAEGRDEYQPAAKRANAKILAKESNEIPFEAEHLVASSSAAPVRRAHHSYIKKSTTVDLHSLKLELKRSLKGQEDPIYSNVSDTSRPDHCKEVTLSLLQEIQLELSARARVGSFKNSIPHPRNLEDVPHAPHFLKTLYKKYKCKEVKGYPLFSKFPAEIRLMILEEVKDPRIIKIEMVRTSGTEGCIIYRSKPPAIFLRC